MADEDKWKRRFHLFMAARLFGLAMFLLGIAIMFTGILRPGGWPVAGSIVVILGLLDAVVAPKLMKKQWDAEDRKGE
jgi:membrane protein implicated in regulation of membrane protease activity